MPMFRSPAPGHAARLALALLSPGAALACPGGGLPGAGGTPWFHDVAVTEGTENVVPHYAGRPEMPPISRPPTRLVVYLTGGGAGAAQPSGSHLIVQTAVDVGFHAIALSYDSLDAAHEPDDCGMSQDLAVAQACYDEVYSRHVWGVNDVSVVPPGSGRLVTYEDSVDGRLVDALHSLEALDAVGRWDGFFDANGAVRYDKVIVVGWSFGAGLATKLGHDTTIQAGVLIDGVKDRYDAPGGVDGAWLAPSWDSSTGQGTPGCRFWGLYRVPQTEAVMLLDQWTSYGVPDTSAPHGATLDGASDNTVGVAVPGERRFYTQQSCDPAHAHESFTNDAYMLRDIVTCAPALVFNPPLVGRYQLRDLYEDILCQAADETCTY